MCRFGQGTESFQVLQNPEPTTLEPSTSFLGGSLQIKPSGLGGGAFAFCQVIMGSFGFLQWLWCMVWVLANSIQWQAMRESTTRQVITGFLLEAGSGLCLLMCGPGGQRRLECVGVLGSAGP